jgi:hypothetical protein
MLPLLHQPALLRPGPFLGLTLLLALRTPARRRTSANITTCSVAPFANDWNLSTRHKGSRIIIAVFGRYLCTSDSEANARGSSASPTPAPPAAALPLAPPLAALACTPRGNTRTIGSRGGPAFFSPAQRSVALWRSHSGPRGAAAQSTTATLAPPPPAPPPPAPPPPPSR